MDKRKKGREARKPKADKPKADPSATAFEARLKPIAGGHRRAT